MSPIRSRGRKTRYAVLVLTRNGASTISETIESILYQDLKPAYVCVVNDGSTDGTAEILNKFRRKRQTKFSVVALADRGYDIRRVPANLNAAYAQLERQQARYDYSMISGDDCLFPRDYSEKLLMEMRRNPRLAIASGDWGVRAPPDSVKAPQGAGRFVLDEFWHKVGGRYPEAYGWETWLIFNAVKLGYRARCYTNVRFEHTRRSGSAHRFRYWGAAMRALGYHPLMVISRVAKNILLGADQIPPSGSLRMLAGYITAGRGDPYYQEYDKELRSFVREHQFERIMAFIRRLSTKA